jgi:acetolactate synthase I/III small subunit
MSAATASAGTPLALTPVRADSIPLHTIAVLVRNQPGVLVRVSLVFARRGYNIESLVVSPDVTNGDFSRMTITCRGDAATFEQISKQLTKLIDVVHAIDHTGQATVETEIALVKIKATDPQGRTEALQIAEHYKAKVVDFGSESLVLRVYGESEKVDSFIGLLRPFGIRELVRSGKILMARGPQTT